jgi:hypothetical protein
MLYVAIKDGQVIGKSNEFSYHDALEWARPVAGYGVEVRPAGLMELCASTRCANCGHSASVHADTTGKFCLACNDRCEFERVSTIAPKTLSSRIHGA